jgi:hypothetical protein
MLFSNPLRGEIPVLVQQNLMYSYKKAIGIEFVLMGSFLYVKCYEGLCFKTSSNIFTGSIQRQRLNMDPHRKHHLAM